MIDVKKRRTSSLPPGGGACWWCNSQLYRRSKDKKWVYGEIEDSGFTRAVHASQCNGSDFESRPDDSMLNYIEESS